MPRPRGAMYLIAWYDWPTRSFMFCYAKPEQVQSRVKLITNHPDFHTPHPLSLN